MTAARAAPHAACAACVHFQADPLAIERFVPGLRSFGSGFASVRADDGLCLRHGRYLAASSFCADFRKRKQPD
jgi:hypothetical protein